MRLAPAAAGTSRLALLVSYWKNSASLRLERSGREKNNQAKAQLYKP